MTHEVAQVADLGRQVAISCLNAMIYVNNGNPLSSCNNPFCPYLRFIREPRIASALLRRVLCSHSQNGSYWGPREIYKPPSVSSLILMGGLTGRHEAYTWQHAMIYLTTLVLARVSSRHAVLYKATEVSRIKQEPRVNASGGT